MNRDYSHEWWLRMWTHWHLLPAWLYFNDKNKFLFELWPNQSALGITFSAGVCPCSYTAPHSPASCTSCRNCSSQRLLQALLRSQCLEDLVQSARKQMKKLEKAGIFLTNVSFSLQTPQRPVYLYSLSSQNYVSCISLPNAEWVNETSIPLQATTPLWFSEGTGHLSENSF